MREPTQTPTPDQRDTFTPGPWTATIPWGGFGSIEGPNGELVFGLSAGMPNERQPPDVCEANVRLIAAAPKLLYAARAIKRTCPCDPDATREFNVAWGLLEAALFEAEGRV